AGCSSATRASASPRSNASSSAAAGRDWRNALFRLVGRRHRGLDRLAPGEQFRVQGLHALGLRLRQVLLLADVVLEVVEFQPARLEELDQLPVAVADRAGGRRPPFALALAEVAGEVPVQGRALPGRLALQHAQVTGAVELLFGGLRAGHLQE